MEMRQSSQRPGGFQITGGRREEAGLRRDGGPESDSGALEVPEPLSSPGWLDRLREEPCDHFTPLSNQGLQLAVARVPRYRQLP